MRLLAAVAAAVLTVACGRTPPAPALSFAGSPTPSAVEVRGLPSTDIQALATGNLTTEQWQDVLRVQIAKSSGSGIAGTYTAQNGTIRFTPMFGFDQGRTYIATFNAARIPGVNAREPWRQPRLQRVVTLPGAPAPPQTEVTQVYPSGPVLPENMLRFYIEFSAPMGRGGPLEHIRLLTDDGKEVADPFLPVEAEFWNPERTRFTLFFDPGRVKRGIKPNRDMGRALVVGRRYTLIVSDRLLDGNGRPLKEAYRHAFTAGPAEESALDPAKWNVIPPVAGTRGALTVLFPKPLDHGLLQRALGVQKTEPGAPGSGVDFGGEIRVEGNETRWVFTPTEPWTSGTYALVALPLLEDPAGNRIGRAFEVRSGEEERRQPARIPFQVK